MKGSIQLEVTTPSFIYIRSSDCSTDIEDRNSLSTFKSRFSLENSKKNAYLTVPVTPNSDLFVKPNQSPEYFHYNKCLFEFYKKIEEEAETSVFDSVDKSVLVKNTSYSTLLSRRNNSSSRLPKNLKLFQS